MDASWGIWILATLLFAGAISLLKSMPGGKDFRAVAGALGIIGLALSTTRADLRWHLIWFTPLALAIAYVYALRRLFSLSHRINKIVKSGTADPEQIRRTLQGEVDEFNRNEPDDQKLR